VGTPQIAPRTRSRRFTRVAIVAASVVAVLVVTRLLVAPLPSERSLGWRTAYGFPGAEAGSGMVVPVEVERPGCAPDGTSWLDTPVVTYTPVAVFITIRMAEYLAASGCSAAHDGRLPTVGSYLTGTYVAVHLSQPLMGRMLVDGAGLIPEPRLFP
jgi:hypothetical protein